MVESLSSCKNCVLWHAWPFAAWHPSLGVRDCSFDSTLSPAPARKCTICAYHAITTVPQVHAFVLLNAAHASHVTTTIYIRDVHSMSYDMMNYKGRQHANAQKALKTSKNNTKNAKIYTSSRSMSSIFDTPLVLSVFSRVNFWKFSYNRRRHYARETFLSGQPRVFSGRVSEKQKKASP